MNLEFNSWKDEINRIPEDSESGGRLALYRVFKEELCPEEYIKKIIPRDRRRTIVMIRTGCLGLAVETGRYRSPKTPRIVIGNVKHAQHADCVEDEVHFIVACPAFNFASTA